MDTTTAVEAAKTVDGGVLAAARNPNLIDVDALVKSARASGTAIDGPGGLLAQITKQIVERTLEVEMTEHLGYEPGDPAGRGTGNSRNGSTSKRLMTTNGHVDISVPRDRNAEFEPQIVPKHTRRLGNIQDMILSLYSRGMTTRDIGAHLMEIYGVSASPDLIWKGHRRRAR